MSNSIFNVADYIAFAVVVLGTLLGLKRGLTGQVAFLLAGFGVLAALFNGYYPCLNWLQTSFSLPFELARILAIGILVIVPLAMVLSVYHLTNWVLKVTFTKWIDRLGGALFGMAGAIAFVILVFVLLNLLPAGSRPPGVGTESWIGQHLVSAEGRLSKTIEARIDETRAEIKTVRETKTGKREKWEE